MIASKPAPTLRAAFLRMLDDYEAHEPKNGEHYAAARGDFATYVQFLLDEERGVHLVPGHVPCTHRWLVDDGGDIGGVVRIRHTIDTDFLREEGGHIGYDVPPSRRGHGNGTACLRAGLEAARELGLPRVLLVADTDNAASWRIIEKCGGVLEVERVSAYYGVMIRRYWIDVATRRGSSG